MSAIELRAALIDLVEQVETDESVGICLSDRVASLRAQQLLASTDPDDLAWACRRMLQALDAYWMNYEGRPVNKMPRGSYEAEDWWHRFEQYRKLVEGQL